MYLGSTSRIPALYLTRICYRIDPAVGIAYTWRIVKASWRYLASFRLAGDPVASGVLGAGLGVALGVARIGVGAAGYGGGMCCCAAMNIRTAA
jgi:hypothetical protein